MGKHRPHVNTIQGSQPRTAVATRHFCIVRKLAAACHKLNSRRRPPLNPETKDHIEKRSDKPGPPCTALRRVRILARADRTQGAQKECSMKFSTLCSPSSSEERRSFSSKLLAHHSLATDGTLSPTFQGFCSCGRRVLSNGLPLG